MPFDKNNMIPHEDLVSIEFDSAALARSDDSDAFASIVLTVIDDSGAKIDLMLDVNDAVQLGIAVIDCAAHCDELCRECFIESMEEVAPVIRGVVNGDNWQDAENN